MINKEFSCNLFLYPEKAVKVSGDTRNRTKELFDLNRFEYKTDDEDEEDTRPLLDDERIVKVWCSCDDFDNLSKYGFPLEYNDKMYKVKIDEYLPVRFFDGCREGDTITKYINLMSYVKYDKTYEHDNNNNRIPLSKRNVTWGDGEEFLIKFKFTLLQEQYKYSSLGSFQKALRWCYK